MLIPPSCEAPALLSTRNQIIQLQACKHRRPKDYQARLTTFDIT